MYNAGLALSKEKGTSRELRPGPSLSSGAGGRGYITGWRDK